ncbi:MAG: peptidylprolyl isomerase [Bacteroidia bacterium]
MKKNIFLLLLMALSIFATAQKPVKTKSKVKPKPVKPLNEYVLISTNFGNMVFTLYDETPLHRDNFKKLIKSNYYDDLLFHRIIRDYMIQGGDPNSRNADSNTALGNGGPEYTIPAEINPNIIHSRGALAAARTGDNINPKKESSGSQFYIVQGKKVDKKELEEIMNAKNYQRKQEVFNNIVTKDTAVANRLNLIQQSQGKEAVQQYVMKQLGPVIDEAYKKKEYIYNGTQIDTYKEYGGTPFLDMDYTVFGQMVAGFDVLEKISILYNNPQTNRPFQDVKMKIRIVKK